MIRAFDAKNKFGMCKGYLRNRIAHHNNKLSTFFVDNPVYN